jgi:aspartyl-tRNA(Asn)/glutamyl-tRNA(Gln) amidotransferase subunit A
MNDPCFATAAELATAYRKKALSPVEATRAVLARIGRLDRELRAFCQVDADGALNAARAAEARFVAGAPLGPLDGVPVSVKDHLQAKGLAHPRGVGPMTPSEFDCPPVARLREGGAVILGKTTMPELSVIPVTSTRAFGVTRNPWNTAYSSGGSSGGAATAVAAGMGPLALGTDGGGSIRLPAAFTNLVGHKPTLGRVPYHPGQTDRTVCGPIARTTEDAGLLMNAIARPDGRDWMELPRDDTDYVAALNGGVRGMRGMRLAYSRDLGFARVAPEIAAVVEAAVARLEQLGATVEPLDAVCDDASATYMIQAALRYADARLDPAQQPPIVRRVYEFAATITAADVQRMLDQRNELGRSLTAQFMRFDAILSPTAPVRAPKSEEFYPDGDVRSDEARNLIGLCCPFNLVHMPAVSAPCGFTADGLPVGLQIAGPKFSDAKLLRIAHTLERALDIARCAPDSVYAVLMATS